MRCRLSGASFFYLKTMPKLFNIFINYLGDWTEDNKSMPFPAVSMDRMRGNGHIGTQQSPFKLFDCEGNQISEQLGQIGCGAPRYCWRYPKPGWIWSWESCCSWCCSEQEVWPGQSPVAPSHCRSLWCWCPISTVSTAQVTLPLHWGDTCSARAALWTPDPFLSTCSLTNYSFNFTFF